MAIFDDSPSGNVFTFRETKYLPESMEKRISVLETTLSEIQQLANSLMDIVLANGLIMPSSDDDSSVD